MKSYLNSEKLKTDTLQKLKISIAQHKIEQTVSNYWEDGKGTAMGVISECDEGDTIAAQYGFPEQLLGIQNHIFKMLPTPQAEQFSVDFLERIPLGVDLNNVWKKYFIWLFVEVDNSLMDVLGHIDLARITIEKTVDTLQKSLTTTIPDQLIETITLSVKMNVRNVGFAADRGAFDIEMAGLMLASTQWAMNSFLYPNFADMVLPAQGSVSMWELLADKLLELIQN